jgi:extradiol dioxygenase family protein
LGKIEKLDYCGHVDGISVPIPHFGCILTEEQFEQLCQKLEAAQVEFIVKPQQRYEGQPSQQLTMFVLDASGNPLEFKAFKDEEAVFSV